MNAETIEKVANPVRKGDAVLVQRTQTSYVIGQGSSSRTEFVFMLVASGRRNGEVAKVSDHADGSYGHPIPNYWQARYWTIPATKVDVPALLAAFEARTWPSGNGNRYPFSDFDEAKDFARDFKHAERLGA